MGPSSSQTNWNDQLYQHLQLADLTRVVFSRPFQQNVDVDFEPLVFALPGLGAFGPVFCIFEFLNPRLPRDLLLSRTVVVVDHPAVQQTHGCELMDARDSTGFGDGRVDVGEGVSL